MMQTRTEQLLTDLNEFLGDVPVSDVRMLACTDHLDWECMMRWDNGTESLQRVVLEETIRQRTNGLPGYLQARRQVARLLTSMLTVGRDTEACDPATDTRQTIRLLTDLKGLLLERHAAPQGHLSDQR